MEHGNNLEVLNFCKDYYNYTLKLDDSKILTIEVEDNEEFYMWIRTIFGDIESDTKIESNLEIKLTPRTIFDILSDHFQKKFCDSIEVILPNKAQSQNSILRIQINTKIDYGLSSTDFIDLEPVNINETEILKKKIELLKKEAESSNKKIKEFNDEIKNIKQPFNLDDLKKNLEKDEVKIKQDNFDLDNLKMKIGAF